MNKSYLQAHVGAIKRIKTVLAVLLGLMILADVVLVFLDKHGFPTYSRVVDSHQNEFIWLSFLYGGLVAKVFFNRKAKEISKEVHGFLAFASVVYLLFLFGGIFQQHIDDLHLGYQLLLIGVGGYVAYRAWPQYEG